VLSISIDIVKKKQESWSGLCSYNTIRQTVLYNFSTNHVRNYSYMQILNLVRIS